MMDFDATSFYPSAMWDKKTVSLKKTGFVFKPHMNDVYVKTFNNQTFNQDSDESAIVKKMYYNPPNMMFQPLPGKQIAKQKLID